jgi:glycerophosphoryl diester phosphodiesterase
LPLLVPHNENPHGLPLEGYMYVSFWYTPFDYIHFCSIKYVKFLIQTVDNSPIDSYSSVVLHDIFEPLVIPQVEKESAETSRLINENIRIINHRGYNFEAPENTMPAFKLSVEKGYRYIETDISFTKDNIPVLIHDETIDRTSNGTGAVNSYTYNELLAFDFGSWFNTKYQGTRIPTLEEFLKWCKYTGVHPYLELKYGGTTEENIINVVNLVKKYGMLKNCTFISAEITFLQIIKGICPFARIGLSCQTLTSETLNNVVSLKTDSNDVFVSVYTYNLTDENADECMNNDVGLEMWVVNGPSAVPLIKPYVTGITTDNYDLSNVLFESVN